MSAHAADSSCPRAAADMTLFDAMPPRVRALLRELAPNVPTAAVAALARQQLQHGVPANRIQNAVLQALKLAEADEIAALDRWFLEQHGSRLPHAAARASVLR